MQATIYEFIGTAILVLLGNGVVANVVLSRTKGNGGGWIIITMGWAMALFTAVLISSGKSGAHLNPAVTLALAVLGKFEWVNVFPYIIAQLFGAAIGSALVIVCYKDHFLNTDDKGLVAACFHTAPAIKNPVNNFMTEVVATFVLFFGICHFTPGNNGTLDALPVALLVLGLGLCLGGSTGYALNPARDLGPRIIHSIFYRNEHSDWSYAWVPTLGPITGALIAALTYNLL